MCVCAYVCMCLCVYVYMCMCVCVYTVYVCMCVCVYVCVYMYMCVCVYVYAYMCICVDQCIYYASLHTCMHWYMHVCLWLYDMCIRIYTSFIGLATGSATVCFSAGANSISGGSETFSSSDCSMVQSIIIGYWCNTWCVSGVARDVLVV